METRVMNFILNRNLLLCLLISLTFLAPLKTTAQCSGYFFGGPSSACTNVSLGYFISGGNVGTGVISSVSGDASSRTWTSGSGTIKWLLPGSYTINFSCSCGTVPQVVTVTQGPSINSVISPSNQTICSGQTPASISVAPTDYSGPIYGWQMKRPSDASWTNISGTGGLNTLSAANISNTETYQYQMVLYQCNEFVYSAISTVNVTPPLATPETPTTGDITSNCGTPVPISISTNYPSGYTITHYYYSHNGALLSTQTTTNPTSTVYISQYTPNTSDTQYQLQAEVQATGGCPSVQSARKTINYTVSQAPTAPPITFLLNSSPVSSINVCGSESINLTASGGTSNYAWYKPSGGASFNSSSSLSNFVPTESGTYTVNATWSNPCGGTSSISGSIQITVSTPSFQLSNPGSAFCSNAPPTFSTSISPGASNISYQWSMTGGYTGNQSTFAVPSNLSTGSYTVTCTATASFSGLCQGVQTLSASRTIQITQLTAPPTPTTGDITTTCGAIAPISISTSYPAGYTITHYYYHQNGSLLSAQPTTNPTGTVYQSQYTPTTSGTQYQLQAEVQATGGCPSVQSARKTINYTINPPPTAPPITFLLNSSPTSSINTCSGEAINLTASGGTSNYSWFKPSGGASFSSSSSLSNFIPTEGGLYTVNATWSGPCGSSPISGTIQITVSTPSLLMSDPGSNFCSDLPPTFSTTISSGATNVSYQWSMTGGYAGNESAFAVPSNLSTGNYTVTSIATATFSGMCQAVQTLNASRTIHVTQVAPPPIPVSTSNSCAPQTLSFNGIPPTGTTWYWETDQFGMSNGPKNASNTFNASSSGTYYLRSFESASGCWGPSSPVTVTVDALPQDPRLTASFSVIGQCGSANVNVSGNVPGGQTWYWEMSDDDRTIGSVPATASPLSVYSTSKVFVRALNGANGCWSLDPASINVAVSSTLPDTPPTPAPITACGEVTLNRLGTVPSGENWYWVGMDPLSTKTILGSGATSVAEIRGSTSVSYYLRPLNVFGCWGTAVEYKLIPQVPQVSFSPALPIVCNNSSASISASGDGVSTLIWYDNTGNNVLAQGTSLSTPPLTQTTSYKYDVFGSEGCYSSGTFTVQVVPKITAKPKVPLLIRTPGQYSLDMNNINSASINYYWVSSPHGKETIAYSNPRVVTTPGLYYIRGQVSGCWGPAVSVKVPDLSAPVISAQSTSNQNYVKVYNHRVKNLSGDPELLPADQIQLNTNYIDGLGRVFESVSKQGSPYKFDAVKPVTYDGNGRETRDFLPYTTATSSGEVQAQPFLDQLAFYQNTSKVANSSIPFDYADVEDSPLERPLKEFGAGIEWTDNDKKSEHQYPLNQASEVVLFSYDPNSGLISVASGTAGYYEAGQLTVHKSIDEQKNDVIEYDDKYGRTVCKKILSDVDASGNKAYASTYYIHDDIGNLVVVLPPEAVKKFVK